MPTIRKKTVGQKMQEKRIINLQLLIFTRRIIPFTRFNKCGKFEETESNDIIFRVIKTTSDIHLAKLIEIIEISFLISRILVSDSVR